MKKPEECGVVHQHGGEKIVAACRLPKDHRGAHDRNPRACGIHTDSEQDTCVRCECQGFDPGMKPRSPKRGEWIAYAERLLRAIEANTEDEKVDLAGIALELSQCEMAIAEERRRSSEDPSYISRLESDYSKLWDRKNPQCTACHVRSPEICLGCIVDMEQKHRPKGVYECDACGNIEPKEREVMCWVCGKGEMQFRRFGETSPNIPRITADLESKLDKLLEKLPPVPNREPSDEARKAFQAEDPNPTADLTVWEPFEDTYTGETLYRRKP